MNMTKRADPSTDEIKTITKSVHLGWVSSWAMNICTGVQAGTLRLELPNGEIKIFAGENEGPNAYIHLLRWRAVRRMIFGGDIGFAEGYMAGDWSTTDLTALIELAAINKETMENKVRGNAVVRWFDRLNHVLRPNTKRGSRKNIQAHYDLGNDFYQEWLDPTMTYSSGIYENANDPLDIAQIKKYARIAEVIDPKPGQTVLEIGCGWGGFASYAAKTYGCNVVGITLSQEQHDFATARMEREGLSDLVDIRIQDYRDVTGHFDGIASIEMFEAVGEKNWPSYFKAIGDRLHDNGRAAIQVITIDEDRYASYRRSADFIQRYVFPGGMLPSASVFRSHAEDAGLSVKDSFFFGQSYAHTMAEWHVRFTEAWPSIEKIGFDERFRRLWEYYLAYCRAGFQTGAINVGQFSLVKS